MSVNRTIIVLFPLSRCPCPTAIDEQHVPLRIVADDTGADAHCHIFDLATAQLYLHLVVVAIVSWMNLSDAIEMGRWVGACGRRPHTDHVYGYPCISQPLGVSHHGVTTLLANLHHLRDCLCCVAVTFVRVDAFEIRCGRGCDQFRQVHRLGVLWVNAVATVATIHHDDDAPPLGLRRRVAREDGLNMQLVVDHDMETAESRC
mmetsp:Transcript_7150/g.19228  ORF Transcript_7150/g.19228 Transcript_7150/m.19228 type:complete len:203 (-) Transcript_7150:34-642(-)